MLGGVPPPPPPPGGGEGRRIRADFGRIGVRAAVEVEDREGYLVLTLAELNGPDIEAFAFINLQPTIA